MINTQWACSRIRLLLLSILLPSIELPLLCGDRSSFCLWSHLGWAQSCARNCKMMFRCAKFGVIPVFPELTTCPLWGMDNWGRQNRSAQGRTAVTNAQGRAVLADIYSACNLGEGGFSCGMAYWLHCIYKPHFSGE